MVNLRCLRNRPTAEIQPENTARRDRVQRCMDNAQQEEAFREFLRLLGAHGGKMPYGAVDKLVHSYHSNDYKAINKKNYIIVYRKIKRKLH
jgi:hypothetical protein